MTKRFGFTLAEVLITLGIIGVVAAMTIPTLISNTNGAQFKSRYKKALSTLNQAAVMNVALDDYDFSSLKGPNDDGEGGDDGEGENKKTMSYILMNRLSSVSSFEYSDEDAVAFSDDSDSPLNGTDTDSYYSFNISDGTSFSYLKTAGTCSSKSKAVDNDCVGFIDVNGTTGPNEEVECTNIDGKVNNSSEDDGGDKCEVDSEGVKDIYPVIFYGQTVEPATDAARAVLFGK